MKKFVIVACGFAVLAVANPMTANAQQSGLAGMHAQRLVKGRLCFSDHSHVGTGSPARSKRQAIASAAQSWSSFTGFEYGSSWGSWRAATAKQVNCESSGGNWSCEVQATPCLLGKRRRLRQARR